LAWFQKAARLDDIAANVAIAKLYITRFGSPSKAKPFVMRAIRADAYEIAEVAREEAQDLLRRLDK
jgi:hypothetical protein